MISLKAIGLEELRKKLGDLPKALLRALEAELNKIGPEAVKRVQVNAPIRSGYLRSQARYRVQVNGTEVILELYDDAPYALQMHEEVRALGAVSRAQPNTPEGGVGRKYIQRVVDFHTRRWQLRLGEAALRHLGQEAAG